MNNKNKVFRIISTNLKIIAYKNCHEFNYNITRNSNQIKRKLRGIVKLPK